jgi:hypothetical protein
MRELVVARGDTPIRFEPLEEVLHAVALAVSALGVMQLHVPRRFWRDAGNRAKLIEKSAEGVCIVSFVRNDKATGDFAKQGRGDPNISCLSRAESYRDGSAPIVHQRVDLGIESPLCSPHLLGMLAAGGIGPMRVDFDMTGIEKTKPSRRLCLDALEQLLPEATLGPASIVLIDRIPGGTRPIDRTPTTTFAEHEKNAFENDFDRQRRSSPLRILLGIVGFNVLWNLQARRAPVLMSQ